MRAAILPLAALALAGAAQAQTPAPGPFPADPAQLAQVPVVPAQPGYAYPAPGYGQRAPGYPPPGYAVPGQPVPGYVVPGYPAPGYHGPPPGYYPPPPGYYPPPGYVPLQPQEPAGQARPGARGEPEHDGPTGKVPIGYAASGRLTMTAVSDYPGPWRATLDQPIYTIDRRHVLFPEGSVIVGRTVLVGGQNQAINNRLGFLPTHIVRPDGEAFSIRQQAVLDELGIGAIADQVDYHLGTQLAAVGAFSAIEALPDIIKDQATNERDVIGNFFEQGSSQGQVILQRYLTLLPTVTVRAGTPMRIFFQEELVVPLTRPRDRFELTNIAPGPAPAPAAAAPATRR